MSNLEASEEHPLSLHAEEEPLDEPPPYESIVLDKPDHLQDTTSKVAASSSQPRPQPTFHDHPSIKRTYIKYGEPRNPSFQIQIIDPVKQGEGVGAYISYKVVSTVHLDGYRTGQHEVIRRFRDFTWLKYRLRSQYKGILPPPLPEKNVLEKYKMAAEFIEQRRASLEIYLNRIAAHSVLSRSPDFRLFLQLDENEFAIEASRSAAENGDAAPAASGGAANAARKTISGAVKLFKSLSQQAASLAGAATSPPTDYSSRNSSTGGGGGGFGGTSTATATATATTTMHDSSSVPSSSSLLEGDEKADYIQARAYISELENHLEEAHTQAVKVVKHYNKLSLSLAEFGAALTMLARRQGSSPLKDAPMNLHGGDTNGGNNSSNGNGGAVRNHDTHTTHNTTSNTNDISDRAVSHLTQLSERSLAASSICQKTAEHLSKSFEAPMKEFLRQVKSAKKAMNDRHEALMEKKAARHDVDARRSRLARLRGTIGIKEERVIEAERDLQIAHTRAEVMSQQYESIAQRMDSDIGRFQKERIEEMRSVLFDFAVAQGKAARDIAQVWGVVVE